MKGSDRAVVLGVIMALVLAGFYLKVLGPKRDEASSLKKDIADVQSQIAQQKQVADFAEDARAHFPQYYGRLVVLGKAVPGGADTSSLLVELNSIATRTGVKFNGLSLGSGSGTGSPAASTSTSSSSSTSSTSGATGTPASGTGSTGTSTTGSSPTGTTPASTTSTTGTATPAAATEATAANLPLGASVGPAGLPTMPYDLTFVGSYFDVADFIKGVDDLVHLRGSSQVAADGRLLTVNGFSLTPTQDSDPSNPTLEVKLAVTSFVTPADQGLTAGATPGGPAPPGSVTPTQPASATVTTP